MTTYTSSNRGSGIHSSRSAIRVLPSIRRASRPNGIFSVDSNSSSDFSLYSSSSDMSSSSENEWSDDDFEDPLWVKDDNLRRPRRRSNRHVAAPPPTPSSSSQPSFADHMSATCSDDNMVLEEDVNISSDISSSNIKAPMAIEEQQSTPRKRGRDKKAERKSGSSNSKTGSKAKKRDQQTAAYREFAMRLDTSALENHPAPAASVGLTPRRCKAFSVSLTPRGGFFSSSPSPSSTSSTSSSPSASITTPSTKVTPQRRERERRQIEREILTQKQQQQRQQQLAMRVPPLSLAQDASIPGSSPKKDDGNFWRKKMRGVKAYFSSSSSASVAPASPVTTRPTSHSAPVSPALRDVA